MGQGRSQKVLKCVSPTLTARPQIVQTGHKMGRPGAPGSPRISGGPKGWRQCFAHHIMISVSCFPERREKLTTVEKGIAEHISPFLCAFFHVLDLSCLNLLSEKSLISWRTSHQKQPRKSNGWHVICSMFQQF